VKITKISCKLINLAVSEHKYCT